MSNETSTDNESEEEQSRPGDSLYNGLFALDGVTGSATLNNLTKALGQSAFKGAESIVEAVNPAAGAAWNGFKKASQSFQNMSSTAGKILRIRGRLPNLDPHVYGDDGPLSTRRSGTLFNFLNPLKSYLGGKVFSEVASQVQNAVSGNSGATNSGGDNSAASGGEQDQQPKSNTGDQGGSGAPDLSQLAISALQNAQREIVRYTTPMLTLPTNAIRTIPQVDRGFSITAEFPAREPLARNRKNDALLVYGKGR